MLFILIQIRSVQTYLGREAAIFLSSKLNTRVEIGSVDIEFFRKIVLQDVYVQDLHKDTLLYAKKLKISINRIDFKAHQLHIADVILLNCNSKIIKYKAEDDFNFQFILDSFKNTDTTATHNAPWDVKFKSVTLINSAFVFRSEHDTLITTGVNYFDVNARRINTEISDIRFDKDTIRSTIDYLSAKERSGFIIQNLSSYVKISPVGIQLDELRIKTPESNIATDLTFKYDHYRDFKDFINKVTIKADFDHSRVEMADIAYFAPALKGIYKNLTVSGKIKGLINDLRGKDMDIYLGGYTRFTGDVTLTGLPHLDETSIYLNVKNLSTNYGDLKLIPVPPFTDHKTLDVPYAFAKLGNMKFKGTFTGLYNDFYAYGDFTSALGNLSSDLSVRHDTLKKKEFYKGKLKSAEFDFGKFFGVASLGKVTMNVDVDGSGFTLSDVAANLKGTVNSININNYTYQNIAVEGTIANKIFKGKLNVADDNIDLNFIGGVDFTHKLPHLDFVATVNNADLGALHFIKDTTRTNLSTQVIVDVTGNNIDNLIGQINFDNTIYKRKNEVYKMSVFNLVTEEEKGSKSIRLNSDFLDAKINGTFKILDMPLSIEYLLSKYLPSYFRSTVYAKTIIPQNFDYNFLFKKTDAVTRLFAPDIKIAPSTLIKGNFNSATNHLVIKGNSDKLMVKGFEIKDWHMDLKTNGLMDFETGCARLYTSDSSWLTDFNISTQTHADSVNLALTWDNKTKNNYKGDIKAFLNIHTDKSIKFKILPSVFIVADSAWAIDKDNEILIDTSHIAVNSVTFEHGNQSFSLNGIVSQNKMDELKLLLTNFNLANANLFTKGKGVTLKGTIDGASTFTDFYHDLVFSSDNVFKSVFINENELGDGNIKTTWDNPTQALKMNGSFTLGIVPNIVFSGYYYPKKEENNLDMDINMEALRMDLFEPFVKQYCSKFKGFFAGKLKIKGSLKKPELSGIVNVNAKNITVDYLNTKYNFSQNVVVNNNSFGVENMTVYDDNGNTALVRGKVYHDNFKNFQLDFDIQANKFMCLNTSEADNSSYYGKAYITGIVNIFGYTDNIRIDANVRTEKITPGDRADKFRLNSKTELTKFYIPLSKQSEISESNFVTYVKKDSTIKIKDDYKVKLGGLTLNFDLDVTPDAEVQLIFDQKVGDIIKARGTGTINLNISSKGDFKMYGDYVIDNGDYLFTLQNIINKRFELEKGGTIRWSGIPYKADMNLSAVYKARASLKPFFPEDSTSNMKKRFPVDLKLLMTGDLLSPEINFDIGLPTVDADKRQTVLSYINTDAERNRQVFSLLILNSFVTPYQLTNSVGGPTVGSAAGANSSELLSNQLSNMLSKVSKDFDVGVNYRPGDAISKEELGLALSTQLFDDKLTIDGNVSNSQSTNNQNTNNIIGDVNVEYKLTDDGKIRVKAFNKANDNSSNQYASGPYTQGVGIFYREEFDFIGDLFLRYLNAVKPKKKKKEEISK